MDFDPINPFGAPAPPQPIQMFPPIKGPGAVGPPVNDPVQKFGTGDNDNESQFRGSTKSKKLKKKVKKMKKKIVVEEKDDFPDDDF